VSFDLSSKVDAGDFVLYSAHPGHPHRHPGLVVSVGQDSIELVVYYANSGICAAQSKTGVRHEDNEIFKDPILAANLIADGDSGCFVLHPKMELFYSMLDRLDKIEGVKTKKKAAPVVEVKPNTSFRVPEADGEKLTEEQKAERKKVLQEASA
jgi:hypothetical protein